VKERTSDRYQLPTTNECANLLPAAHLDLVTVLSHLGPRLCQDAPFTYILYFRAVLSGSGWYHLCSTEAYGIRVSNIKHQTTIHPAHTSHPSFLSILPLHPSSPSRPRQPKCLRHPRLALRSTSYPLLRRFRSLPRSRVAEVKAKVLPQKLKQLQARPTLNQSNYLRTLNLSTHFRRI
jgi:hypothetical protein